MFQPVLILGTFSSNLPIKSISLFVISVFDFPFQFHSPKSQQDFNQNAFLPLDIFFHIVFSITIPTFSKLGQADCKRLAGTGLSYF